MTEDNPSKKDKATGVKAERTIEERVEDVEETHKNDMECCDQDFETLHETIERVERLEEQAHTHPSMCIVGQAEPAPAPDIELVSNERMNRRLQREYLEGAMQKCFEQMNIGKVAAPDIERLAEVARKAYEATPNMHWIPPFKHERFKPLVRAILKDIGISVLPGARQQERGTAERPESEGELSWRHLAGRYWLWDGDFVGGKDPAPPGYDPNKDDMHLIITGSASGPIGDIEYDYNRPKPKPECPGAPEGVHVMEEHEGWDVFCVYCGYQHPRPPPPKPEQGDEYPSLRGEYEEQILEPLGLVGHRSGPEPEHPEDCSCAKHVRRAWETEEEYQARMRAQEPEQGGG